MTTTDKTPDQLYTPQQVATKLGVSLATVYREIRRKNLAASKIGTSIIRISPEQLERYLQRSAE
jgi:excisionase family DNA binding protein